MERVLKAPDYSRFWTDDFGTTVGDLLRRWSVEKPDKEALVFRERRITWKELNDLTDRLATAYIKMGLKKGDRIGILGPNHPEMLICWFSAAKVGVIPVPLNTRYRKAELEYLLRDSECSAVVTIDTFENFNFIEAILGLKKDLPFLKEVILHRTVLDNTYGVREIQEVIESTEPDQDLINANKPSSSDYLVIIYTSGTTGTPKGVVHTHDSMFVDSKTYLKEVYWITDEDVHIQAMPWTHMIGHENFNNVCLLLGQKNVLMESYKADEFINLIEKERVTWFCGVPTMLTLPMIRVPDLKERNLDSFKFVIVCGFYCPPDQMKAIKETYKVDIIQLVGSSEAGCMLVNRRTDPEEKIFYTVGRPLSNKEVKLCDESGNEVKRGEVGEIWYRGPAIFKFYWNKPDLTKKEKDEQGFWHSGDLGRIVDEEGNIEFMGRSKDVIIRGGFNIYPAEIEAFVMGLPKVESAVLVGFPDKVLGEKTCCYVIPKRGATLSEEELREAFRSNMADYKMPDIIKIVDSVPLLPSGKPDRIQIRKKLLEELGLEEAK